MSDWSKLKEFEIVYEQFDYFFKKQIEVKYDYVKAFNAKDAKEIASFKLGDVDILSVEEQEV
jgi:hypothetical protein